MGGDQFGQGFLVHAALDEHGRQVIAIQFALALQRNGFFKRFGGFVQHAAAVVAQAQVVVHRGILGMLLGRFDVELRSRFQVAATVLEVRHADHRAQVVGVHRQGFFVLRFRVGEVLPTFADLGHRHVDARARLSVGRWRRAVGVVAIG